MDDFPNMVIVDQPGPLGATQILNNLLQYSRSPELRDVSKEIGTVLSQEIVSASDLAGLTLKLEGLVMEKITKMGLDPSRL